MISHVYIGVDDFEAGLTFYSAVLPTLGWRSRFIDRQRPWAGWMPKDVERPLLLVGAPFDGEPAAPGNGHMVALLAPSREAVDDFYVLALANGATCEGPPGLRPEYHPHFYGAYVRAPDGGKLCVCCHEPTKGTAA